MAYYSQVVDPNTQQAIPGIYQSGGQYFKYDPKIGYTPTDYNPNNPAGTTTGTPGGIAAALDPNRYRKDTSGTTLGPSRSAQTPEQQLVDKIYGLTPTDYQGTFDTAYQNAGQPAGGAYGNKAIEGTQTLADAFVNRFHEKTGTLPSEDQVRQFVAGNLTPAFAGRDIAGISNDQIINSYVDPYLQDQGLLNPSNNPSAAISGLNDQYNTIYDAAKQNFLTDTAANYGTQKNALTNDLAGQGMLQNPNSRISLDALNAAQNKDTTSGLNTLNINRATGQVDLAKTIQDLLQKQQQIGNQNSQFNKTFNAGQADTYFNQGLQNRQLALAGTLGRLQANASQPGTLDYLNTALKGLGSVADAYKAFK